MTLRDLFGTVGAALQPAGHVRPLEWLLFVVPMTLLFFGLAYLYAVGDPGEGPPFLAPLRRYTSALEHLTRLPAWAAGGILAGEWSLLMAALGFYWDVAWHVDFGRDKVLFTPPHLMILCGLVGILGAAVTAVVLATVQRARVGLRLGFLHIPRGALPLAGLGAFAVAGFPLDDLWHRTYGIDVTMWSPTHLMMIGAACFTPLALRLLLLEAGPDAVADGWGKVMRRSLMAATLIALTAFQLEFDMGVPQWQLLYQPVMIIGSGAIVMIAARESMGRFAALVVWANYLVVRIFWWVLVGPVLGHVSPHFPLYLGIAVIVELVWAYGNRLQPMARTLVAGGLIATIGLATEWGWSLVWARHPWQPSLLGGIWVAVAMAFAGALFGLALGSVLDSRRPPMSAAVTAIAGLAIVGLMIVPYPRRGMPVAATVTTTAVGEPQKALDRDGFPSAVQEYNVSLRLQPADAATGADYFELLSWQGGKARQVPLVADGTGNYHSARPVPTGGTWKTGAFLTRHDVMDALPISMPADSEYGATAVTVVPVRQAEFVPAPKVLMAEDHGGDALPRTLAIGGFFAELVVVATLFLLAFAGISRDFPTASRGPRMERHERSAPRLGRGLRGAASVGHRPAAARTPGAR